MSNLEVNRSAQVNPTFWNGKRVFLTGHTGFKGGWLSLWLTSMGAKVTGYALAPNTAPNFFEVVHLAGDLEQSHIADIRDLEKLQKAMTDAEPEIVIHMAAQPLVRYSYANPVETYATNVMGTVHVLESIRSLDCVRAAAVVTTDKCYENKEWAWGYRENEPMGGHDPYSNSKFCTSSFMSGAMADFMIRGYKKDNLSDGSHRITVDFMNNLAAAKFISYTKLMPIDPNEHIFYILRRKN